MYWMIILSTLGGLLVLFLLGRRNERAVRRDWELLLTPKGEKLYSAISGRVNSQLQLADMTYDEAFSVHQLGSVEEAKHLLDVGFNVIEKFSPTMLQLLSAMATFSRMVSAMTPVKPLRPQNFKLPQIVSLAYLNRILHQFLVSTGERFRLRVYILGQGFGLATRYLLRATDRILHNRTNAEQEWDQISRIQTDLHTLSAESLRSFRTLLTSLTAERKEEVLELINP